MNEMMSLSTDPTTMSPVALFLQADLVVKGVMVSLLLASVWTWAIIVASWMKIGGAAKGSDAFERAFSKADDVDAFAREYRESDLPSAKVFSAGLAEWRQSTKSGRIDREGTRARHEWCLAKRINARRARAT